MVLIRVLSEYPYFTIRQVSSRYGEAAWHENACCGSALAPRSVYARPFRLSEVLYKHDVTV